MKRLVTSLLHDVIVLATINEFATFGDEASLHQSTGQHQEESASAEVPPKLHLGTGNPKPGKQLV